MPNKAFDVSKFRKSITKSIDGLGVGFNDPDTWISTGNYTLNYLISGSFDRGVPLGKVTVFAGESGCLPESAKVVIKSPTTEGKSQTVSVGELKSLWESGDHSIEIDTPDGFSPITAWFDKGFLPMVEVITTSGLKTRCAHNHLIQVSSGDWVPSENLSVGEEVITQNSMVDLVTKITELSPEECYDFTVNHPNHRYWGDGFSSHNSGKSYICSGNIVKNAQDQGIFVVLIDTENALDESWLQALGVDTSEDKLLKLNMAMIDDVAKTVSEFIKQYKMQPDEERPKVLFIIDSLGMLLTPTDINQFESGDMKGDMGRKAKALRALIANCVNTFGNLNIGMVCTNHTYASQDPYDPDDKISGGAGFLYASSIVVAMKKLKLKEDEDGNKVTDVLGIRAGCKIMKTRYNKPFETIQVKIPYSTGMSPFSGMFDMLEAKGFVTKEGNRYAYVDLNGELHKYFRKEWNTNENGILDLVMKEFKDKSNLLAPPPASFEDESVAE
jgi:RecA/RadA recombinase